MKLLSLGSICALALLLGCSPEPGRTIPPDDEDDDATSGGPSSGGTSGGADGGPMNNDGGTPDAALPDDYFTVVIDGKEEPSAACECSYYPETVYREMFVTAPLTGGSKITLTFFGPSPGEFTFPRQDDILVIVERIDPDKLVWTGKGKLNLVHYGEDGLFEGSAEGVLTAHHYENDPFTPIPSLPPATLTLAWRHHVK